MISVVFCGFGMQLFAMFDHAFLQLASYAAGGVVACALSFIIILKFERKLWPPGACFAVISEVVILLYHVLTNFRPEVDRPS